MKMNLNTIKLTLLPCLFTISGCKDINEVEPSGNTPRAETTETSQPATESEVAPPAAPKVTYPFERMIADAEGRTIEVKVLGKEAGQLGVIKLSSHTMYVFPIDKLSEADQTFLNNLDDGGDFAAVQTKVNRNQKLAGRVAVWNSQYYNSEKEAERLGLPLLAAFIFNEDPRSASLEKKVLYSTGFRSWANQNLALSLIRLDKTTSRKASGLSSSDNREVSSRFGVVDDITLILTLPGKYALQVPFERLDSSDDLINAVTAVIENPETGLAVQAIAIPKRENNQGKGKGKGGRKGGK